MAVASYRFTAFLRWTAILAVGTFLAAAAHATVTVGSINDLRADPAVAALETSFQTLSSAGPIFARCTQEYAITQEQQDAYMDLINRTLKAYNDSYYTTYLTKTGGSPPPQKVVDYYQYYITHEQQALAQEMNQHLDKHSCTFLIARKTYQAVQKLEQDDLAAKASAPTKPTDPWAKQ